MKFKKKNINAKKTCEFIEALARLFDSPECDRFARILVNNIRELPGTEAPQNDAVSYLGTVEDFVTSLDDKAFVRATLPGGQVIFEDYIDAIEDYRYEDLVERYSGYVVKEVKFNEGSVDVVICEKPVTKPNLFVIFRKEAI